MCGDHSMTNGVTDASDVFEVARNRLAFQAFLEPAPSEQRVSDESHQALDPAQIITIALAALANTEGSPSPDGLDRSLRPAF